MTNKWARIGATTAAVATAALVGAAPAGAAPVERHCVLDSKTGAQQCFADYQQVISYASHGTLTTASNRILRSEVAAQPDGEVV